MTIDPDWAWAAFEPDDERPWSRERAAHLYRRAGFSATSKQLDQALTKSADEAVEELLAPPATADEFEKDMRVFGRAMLAGGEPRSLSAWWLYRMLHTPDPLLEKATLFWHGHFATSAEKVTDARLVLAQNELLRKHARGGFAEMVQAISRDPAMLIYLDSATNRKIRPNENYARELLELFCLGIGAYTEQDIQEIARCFTGWEVLRGRFRYNAFEHDDGEKAFLGARGKFGGEQAVEVVLKQSAAPRFIARKLVGYFVFDEPFPPDELIAPLAEQLAGGEYRIAPVLRRILASNLFFSTHAIGRKIRSPVELAVGLLRAFEATTNLNTLAEELHRLGHAPFYPPNVKGWDGGRTWINSQSLLGRANLVRRIVTSGGTQFQSGGVASLAAKSGADGVEEMVDWLLELLVAVPPPAESRDELVRLASQKGDREANAREVVCAIGTLPEFQLN